MSKILSIGSIALAATLLVACGSGNSGQTNAAAYGYGQNQEGVGAGGLCNSQVVQDWLGIVVPSCGQSATPGNGYCNQAVQSFIARDQSFIQGPGCSIPVATAQWCPGNQNGAYMQVNVPILQSILTQHGGPASYPAGQTPYYN